ncbi:hypothetical protein A2875_01885 [Candidatus Gottesmanbacteria bacterium RIFCSPHIGHO2_01_FULL_46_14]|uniref:Phosphoribosyltransferase domain-containing protein n=2 Tax=Candidatus Gottesmaniibacteriota TaxID=1752720 RepID=A0A1F5ZK35_9BACT|nr:MAG: hypothetical protein A2875_01885 [Candidatus Gottesmanbacteria bacterium RIFCSPHIGHO2_01_FULL_46_14]OGG29864.1 MAG: hypothetical protein A2971_01395 [Candidatus Gottesmanbacteria bacterium RIFCSPLOWO2_01_FULL_46_21]
MTFNDRHSAGLLLLEKLRTFFDGKDVVLVGLARGGIVVAAAICRAMDVPLDVLVVKKIPAPGQSELAIGALAPDNVSFIDWKFAGRLGIDENYIRTQILELNVQIKQKTSLYRKGRKPIDIRDKTVIIVDDGVATGATLEAAIKWTRKKHARKIIAALPVMPTDSMKKIKPEVDELVVLETPRDFSAVGQFYRDFPQVGDGEVVELLAP